MKAKEILKTAHDLVAGARGKQHGNILNTHENIALLWTAYRREKYTPLDVALMMSLLKIARTKDGETNSDDFIDGAGYLGVAGELATPKEREFTEYKDPGYWVENHGYHA